MCAAAGRLWLGVVLAVLAALVALVAFRGRTVTGWARAWYAWRRRRATAPPAPSEPAVGATVLPGDHVAVRWADLPGFETDAFYEAWNAWLKNWHWPVRQADCRRWSYPFICADNPVTWPASMR
jgi:hypothetical protein